MKNMKNIKTEDLLDKLGIPVFNYGYRYLVIAVDLYRKDNETKITAIYERIARRCNTTASRVERAIRQCLYKNEEKIQKHFNVNYHITNSRLLALIAREMEREKCV